MLLSDRRRHNPLVFCHTLYHSLCLFPPVLTRFIINPPPSYPSHFTPTLLSIYLTSPSLSSEPLLHPVLPLLLWDATKALRRRVPVGQAFAFRSGGCCHRSGRAAGGTILCRPCLHIRRHHNHVSPPSPHPSPPTMPSSGLCLPHLRYSP